jgi:hypothetical protein
MPYIEPKDRPRMDDIVNHMLYNGVKPDGKLNYVLFKLCKQTVVPESYNSYKNFIGELEECITEIRNSYKNFIGELEECIAEIRRRLLAPYEDEKIKQNGDVE